MYQVQYGREDGTYILFNPMKTAAEIDSGFGNWMKFSAAMGEDGMKKLAELTAATVDSSESNLFIFNPRMSYVSEDWIKADPEFWKPKPAATEPPSPPRNQRPSRTGRGALDCGAHRRALHAGVGGSRPADSPTPCKLRNRLYLGNRSAPNAFSSNSGFSPAITCPITVAVTGASKIHPENARSPQNIPVSPSRPESAACREFPDAAPPTSPEHARQPVAAPDPSPPAAISRSSPTPSLYRTRLLRCCPDRHASVAARNQINVLGPADGPHHVPHHFFLRHVDAQHLSFDRSRRE